MYWTLQGYKGAILLSSAAHPSSWYLVVDVFRKPGDDEVAPEEDHEEQGDGQPNLDIRKSGRCLGSL